MGLENRNPESMETHTSRPAAVIDLGRAIVFSPTGLFEQSMLQATCLQTAADVLRFCAGPSILRLWKLSLSWAVRSKSRFSRNYLDASQ